MNQTVPTTADADAFLAALPDERRRGDAVALAALMARVSGEPATMWGPSIVGFGRYRYRYDSGREGEMMRVGFAARKSGLVVYGTASVFDGFLARLGKCKTGKGCLHISKLADVDQTALADLLAAAMAVHAAKYPT